MAKMMRKSNPILIILVLIQPFFLINLVWAISSISDVKIPSKLGSVKETSVSEKNSKPLIIHIQDAHCNYEAQKNLAQILEYLVKQNNLKLVMVEGGSGDVDLSYLRAYGDKKTREEVADKYLKQGEISGEEYLDISSDYNLELYGIEDKALYDAHMAVFKKVDSLTGEGLKYIVKINSVIKVLKQYIYNTELKQLEERKAGYDNKSISLVNYCLYLKNTAVNKKLILKEFSNLVSFTDSAALEKKINFSQAELERNTFIKDLAALIDENTVKELIAKSQDFKVSKISPFEYYSYLKALSGNKISLESKYPQLNSYIHYITLSKEINTKDLLKEISLIEDKIKETLFSNDDQRSLADISKSVTLLSRLLSLEFTPEDYEYFKANKAKFITASWVDYLSQNCRKYNIISVPAASNLIDSNLELLNEFYQVGAKREHVFMSNLVKKVNESKEKIAVLITGGFHTPGIIDMLKKEGYQYLVVTPAITQKGDSSVYLSVLRGQDKPVKEAFSDEE